MNTIGNVLAPALALGLLGMSSSDVRGQIAPTLPAIYGNIIVTTPAPPALKATVDVECPGGKVWTLSDGSDLGRCQVERSGGQVTGASCSGAEGRARITCTSMGGQGSCVTASGKGSCTEKK